jgi:hypothetical protein
MSTTPPPPPVQAQDELIKTIKALIVKGDAATKKAEDFYIAAGQHLKTLKAQHTGSWDEWEKLLKEKCGIGKSRASELMRIADATTTVEQVRADTARRVMRHGRSSPLANGEHRSTATAERAVALVITPAEAERRIVVLDIADQTATKPSSLTPTSTTAPIEAEKRTPAVEPIAEQPIAEGKPKLLTRKGRLADARERATAIGNRYGIEECRWLLEMINNDQHVLNALGSLVDPDRDEDDDETEVTPTDQTACDPQDAKSWKVIAIAKDGKRYGNGVRLTTEEEVDVYRMIYATTNVWYDFRGERIIIATLAVPTDDAPNVCMERTKKGKIKPTLVFMHGTCHLLGWYDLADGPPPACDVTIGDDVEPLDPDPITASAEARKLEAEAAEALAGNDPGPIPAALDRTVPA